MDKISYYNIETEYNGSVLLYNTLSDSLIRFTENEFSIIKLLLEDLETFKTEYPILYEELNKAGFIVNRNFDELDFIKLQNKRHIFANNDFHITINPTLDCNLNCWYCSTEYAKAKHKGGMNLNLVNNVKSHIQNVIQDQKAASIHLDWFGGEPLMYFDKVIVPISAYANELVVKNKVKFSQHITTNATLMDANRIQQMKKLNFTSFQIPIDGNEARHNKIKHFNDKEGSYRVVVDNINMIADIIPNVWITLRINYDKQTLKHILDIAKDFSDKTKRRIQIDFQKVWQISASDKDKEMLNDTKEMFRMDGFNSDFWAYQPQKFHRCYADKFHQYAINYDGNVFKCTAQDYGADKVIGHLLTDGKIEWNDELLSILFSKSTFENERCLKCKKLPICMGPCIKVNYDSRINNTPLPCVSDNVQYSLTSYIVEDAKKRNLLQ